MDAHEHLIPTRGFVDLPAVLVTLGCTALLLFGTKASANVNTAIVIAKVLALSALIVVGASYVNAAQLASFHPAEPG